MLRLPIEEVLTSVRNLCQGYDELDRPSPNEIHMVVPDAASLYELCKTLSDGTKAGSFYLVTVVGNDERELESGVFKLYYIFSHTEVDLFLWLEYRVKKEDRYPDIAAILPAFEPFQKELADLLGLFPEGASPDAVRGNILHEPYPPDLYPLRRSRKSSDLIRQIEQYVPPDPLQARDKRESSQELQRGKIIVQVGPVHAGVIEPGLFQFYVVGDLVEDLRIKLGYTHKGIERLFQSNFTLEDGWRLAECVAGDSAFAHSLAYCYAVERIAGVEAPRSAEYLRALFVEIERLVNHIGDLSAIAHDVSLEVLASDLAVTRENLLRLNDRICGHRLLRGLTRPGGVYLKNELPVQEIQNTMRMVEEARAQVAYLLVGAVGFRRRSHNIGVLPRQSARECGAVGFTIRASGWPSWDMRLRHPYGIYLEPEYYGIVEEGTRLSGKSKHKGDVLARAQLRFEELDVSLKLVDAILERWTEGRLFKEEYLIPIGDALRKADNFVAALGCVEGWRGDIVYWVMKDKFQRIFRCKVRDPSMLNWPALRQTVIPHDVPEMNAPARTMLADFPLINKSFNLSYSGTDL
jgi:Ni,Fe-hydrogenase III large subunit/Ni,Fe-hydrogenase III component G